MDRIKMRNYARKCAGYFQLLNTILLICAAGLAIYIADWDELDVDEGTGVIVLNMMYVVFTVGAVFAIVSLIAGMIATRGNGEGIFGFMKFTSGIDFLLAILVGATAVYVLKNTDIEWTQERMVITLIYLIAGMVSVVASACSFLYSYTGSRYYDGKKLAKDVPDIEEERLKDVMYGITLLCATLLNIGIAGLSFYFRQSIVSFDRSMVEHNEGFATFFFLLFVVGLIIAVQNIIVSILFFQKQRKTHTGMGKMTVFENFGYLTLFVVASAVSMTQSFVKSQSPDASYLIFAFLLCVISALYLVSAFQHNRRGNK